MADHYEPPSAKLLMEILRILATHGSVTLTVTIASGSSDE